MNLNLSTLIATMLALSVAVERVVEILKQFCASWPLARLLFTARPTPGAENARCSWLHVLSAAIGTVMAHAAHILLLPNVRHAWVNYVIAGLLSSGGSAFWNHALDMMQATKVMKETTARAMVQIAPPPGAMAPSPAD